MAEIVRAKFEPAQFKAFMASVKEFSPALAASTRRRLRDAGQETVAAIKAKLLEPPPERIASGAPAPRYKHVRRPGAGSGIRAGLAAGTKIGISTSAKKQGVSITTSSARLPPKAQAMVRAYNKPTFRHPLFGNPNDWIKQAGRPFFGAVIAAHKTLFSEAIQDAIADAIHEMEGKK